MLNSPHLTFPTPSCLSVSRTSEGYKVKCTKRDDRMSVQLPGEFCFLSGKTVSVRSFSSAVYCCGSEVG